MAVKRIVPNLLASELGNADAFYTDALGLTCVMDQSFIRTYAATDQPGVQVSIASEGGSGTELPALTIEVDDVDAVLARLAESGVEPEYGPVDEPWGARRAYVRDPFGHLINLMAHR